MAASSITLGSQVEHFAVFSQRLNTFCLVPAQSLGDLAVARRTAWHHMRKHVIPGSSQDVFEVKLLLNMGSGGVPAQGGSLGSQSQRPGPLKLRTRPQV